MSRVLLFSILFFACAAYAEGHDYRYIDRPYGPALNEKLVNFGASFTQSGTGPVQSPNAYALSADFEKSLDEDFALIWAPLPLGIIIRDANQTGVDQTGCRWVVSPLYNDHLGLSPAFDSYLRRAVSAGQAFEVQLGYHLFVPFKSVYPMLWGAYLGTNYIFQIGSALALSPGIQMSINDNILLQAYNAYAAYNSEFRMVFPLTMKTDVRISSNVHIAFVYEYRGLGINQDYSTHTYGLESVVRF